MMRAFLVRKLGVKPTGASTLTDREPCRHVLCALTWPTRILIYGNTLGITHKDPTTRFSPPKIESIPKILIALTPPPPHKENPLILGIMGSSPPPYKW